MRGSLSRMTMRARGCASVRASVVARPTMPPPTTTMSGEGGTAALVRRDGAAGDVHVFLPHPRGQLPCVRHGGRIPLPQLERDGAVVGAQDMRQDRRRADAAVQLVGDEEVVDAPPDVPGARAGLHTPPGGV